VRVLFYLAMSPTGFSVKTIVIVIVVLLVVGGAIFGAGWWYFGRGAGANEQALVRLEPASRGDLVEIVSAPGQIEPKEKVSISARVSARIRELPFEEGDHVVKDKSVLVRLDDRDLRADLGSVSARRASQSAQIGVAKARYKAQQSKIKATGISLADAERDLSRQSALLTSRDVSQATFDAAQAKVDGLRAELESARLSLDAEAETLVAMEHNLKAADADIDKAQDALSYTTITSPIDGVVTRLNAKVGELVVTGTMNNAGTVIIEVADLSKMLVIARVDETAVANLQQGQHARVRMQAYPDEEFEGTVDLISLAHTEDRDGTRYFKTEILLKTGSRRLYSGLNADVEIETRRHTGVIKVPSQAVLSRPTDDLPAALRNCPEVDLTKTMSTVVYRVRDGKAVVTPVRIGPSDLTHTIILSGLNVGDNLIAGPY